MNATKKIIALIAILTVTAGSVMAQGQGRRGRGFGNPYAVTTLINRDDVKETLKLTDEQKAKLMDVLAQAQTRRREAFQGLGITDFANITDEDRKRMTKVFTTVGIEITKNVLGALNPDQVKRIKEISIQHEGFGAAADTVFQDELGITEDQKAKIDALTQKMMTANFELFGKVRDGEMEQGAMQDAMKKNQVTLTEEIGKILTADQKAKIKDMSGTPFEIKDTNGL